MAKDFKRFPNVEAMKEAYRKDKLFNMAAEEACWTTRVLNCLADIETMVREEVQYVKTGKHPGIRMRDCVGQWESLAKTAKALREEQP